VPQLNDSELIDLIAHHNEAALGELYDRYNRLVFSIAFAVVGEHGAAEEITLDVFIRIWQKAGTYRAEKARVTTWLTRIARNRAIDTLRREEVRPLKHSIGWAHVSPEPASDHNTESAAHNAMERQRVRAAVGALPDEQQEVLSLAYFKGYTHREIASALDLPLGTVKGRIRGAMHRLRSLLEES
jgi:RNA polymerase sigma-70 factor, ECF subfamily